MTGPRIWLYLYNNQISDKGCEYLSSALAKMTGLKWLYLNNNQIGDKGCKHLSLALVKMEKMTVFHLENNQIGDEGCSHLAQVLPQMTALRRLHLQNNQIGNKGCSYLAPALIQMRVLKFLWLENALQKTGLDIGIGRVKKSRIYEYLGQPYWKGGCLDEFSKGTFYINPGFRGKVSEEESSEDELQEENICNLL